MSQLMAVFPILAIAVAEDWRRCQDLVAIGKLAKLQLVLLMFINDSAFKPALSVSTPGAHPQ
jgi:hypothetical protein